MEMPPPRRSPRELRQRSPRASAAAPASGKVEAVASRTVGRPQVPSPQEKRSVKQEAGASSDDGLRNSSAIDGEVQSAAKLVERVQQALGDGDGPPWHGDGAGPPWDGTDESLGAPTALTTMESSRGPVGGDAETPDGRSQERQDWVRQLCKISYRDQATFEKMYYGMAGLLHVIRPKFQSGHGSM